jgi:hypothetical protein
MAAFIPGHEHFIPSIDPMIITYDISDKGHDWGEFEPKIYNQKDYRALSPIAGYYTCKKCGMRAFSHYVHGWSIPLNVELEPEPEKCILGFDVGGSFLEKSQHQLSCDELMKDKLWVASIDDEERLNKINYYKNDPHYSDLVKAYESLNYADKIYEFGGFKVNIGDGRATFMANMVAAHKINGIVGLRVEPR